MRLKTNISFKLWNVCKSQQGSWLTAWAEIQPQILVVQVSLWHLNICVCLFLCVSLALKFTKFSHKSSGKYWLLLLACCEILSTSPHCVSDAVKLWPLLQNLQISSAEDQIIAGLFVCSEKLGAIKIHRGELRGGKIHFSSSPFLSVWQLHMGCLLSSRRSTGLIRPNG